MKTSVILPVHIVNNELMQMTERCVLSMAQDKPTELIIVDDGSHIPITKSYFTDLLNTKIFRLEPNQGYTRAVNEGLKSAKGDVIIVGNNDLIFEKNWLQDILKPINEGYDISSIQVVDHGQTAKISQEITEGDKFGSLFAIKKKVYKKLGGLDESLGTGYFTDLDYQKRAEKEKFRVGKYWGGTVTHFPKSTFKLIDTNDTQYLSAMNKYKEKYGRVD